MADEQKRAGGWLYIPDTAYHPESFVVKSVVETVEDPITKQNVPISYVFKKMVAQFVRTDEDYEAFLAIMVTRPGQRGVEGLTTEPMFKTGRPEEDGRPLDLTDPAVLAQLKELIDTHQAKQSDELEPDIGVAHSLSAETASSRGVTTKVVGAHGVVDGA